MSRGRWLLGGVLLLVLIGLGVGMRWFNSRPRFVPDVDLLKELASVEFLEEPLAPSDAWPQWRGPNRNGDVTDKAMPREWDEGGPPVLHKRKSGEGFSSFAVRKGLAYTMELAEGKEAVICLDLKSGEVRHRYEYEPSKNFDYGGPRATPTLVGDKVLTVSSDGNLLCLKADDLGEIWKTPMEVAPPRWGFACSPLVVGDTVYAWGAFSLKDGKKLWDGPKETVGYASPVLIDIEGDKQVVFFTGTRLVGVEAKTGSEAWSYPWDTQFQVNAATPLPIRARKDKKELLYVFISSGYHKGCALVKVSKTASGFAAKAVYESNELCCHFATPVRRGGYVYALDETRDLSCLNLRTGAITWRHRGFRKGSLIRVDDTLLLLGETGNLALAATDPEEYRESATAKPLRDRCWALPALAEGKLLLRDRKTMIWLDVSGK